MNTVQTSENTLVVLFEQSIETEIANQVSLFQANCEQDLAEYIVDIIPSYASLTLVFDFRKISGKALKILVSKLLETTRDKSDKKENFLPLTEQRIVEIPVYYDDEVGFDLRSIAESKNLTVDAVIKIHSEQLYDVYAVGFAPGFAYLGSVDPRIAMPRKKTPRKIVPQGSLGIAGQQTAIYPADSPGGWQIIGRTPEAMVDYDAVEPSKIKTSDKVRFVPISKQRYLELGGEL